MSSAERAALNAPRQSSMSSQMAAITAAQDRDEESPSPPGGGIKGKLDQPKLEPMDIKQEDTSGDMHMEGGKNIKNELCVSDIKKEDPSDDRAMETSIKEEPGVHKDIPKTTEPSSDIKPIIMPEAGSSGADKKLRKCSEYSIFTTVVSK